MNYINTGTFQLTGAYYLYEEETTKKQENFKNVCHGDAHNYIFLCAVLYLKTFLYHSLGSVLQLTHLGNAKTTPFCGTKLTNHGAHVTQIDRDLWRENR